VVNFFCGCADLRKGALIIGIIKLVFSCITAFNAGLIAVKGALLIALIATNPGAQGAQGGGVIFGIILPTIIYAIINLAIGTVVLAVAVLGIVVNILLIRAATGKGSTTMPWLVVTMIGIVIFPIFFLSYIFS